MSQFDFGTLDPTVVSGTTLATDLNSWRSALHSDHSGPSAPTYVVEGMTWLDTSGTPWISKRYAGGAWVTLGTLNASTHVWTPAGGGIPNAIAAGTVDAITATFSPALVLANKPIFSVYCAGANTSTTPSFTPDGGTPRTITKQGGQALAAGDIPRAGFWALMQYDVTNTRYELLNPAAVAASTPVSVLAAARAFMAATCR